MSDSEILNIFDEKREEFKPYGFTCEWWFPNRMKRPDRHNEIELNYFLNGNVTYFFQHRKITVPPRRLTVFWALIPHQIIHFDRSEPYFVCTVPFSMFLEWNLPASFVDQILKGTVLSESSGESSDYDEFLLKNWISDFRQNRAAEVSLLEIRARLSRLAANHPTTNESNPPAIQHHEISQVEKMAIFIAQNCARPIKVAEIGSAVGLHPDYANAVFRKAFGCTLTEYLQEERISQAQRKLVTTGESIAGIAYGCGFNSISRFNATFLKLNGCTPREYRTRARKTSGW